MLGDEEYSSDTSDDDYIPAGAEEGDSSVNESEEGEAESEESEAEEGTKGKTGKSKKKKGKGKKGKQAQAEEDDSVKEATAPISSKLNDKRIESLWASFKESPATPNTSATTASPAPQVAPVAKDVGTIPPEPSASSDVQETPVTTSKQEKSIPPKPGAAAAAVKRPGPVRSGGLADLASRLSGKKPKLSTLEKSKQDWDTFKRAEGIEEELKTFNQGKMGYLERKAFLERADVKQFEIEKGFRLSRKPQ